MLTGIQFTRLYQALAPDEAIFKLARQLWGLETLAGFRAAVM